MNITTTRSASGRASSASISHSRRHRYTHGIPVGTNWSVFSRTAGSIIGQTLAMEGIFSFFLESSFLGLLLYGERRWADSATGRLHCWCGSVPVLRYLIVAPMLGCSVPSLCGWSARSAVFGEFLGLLLNRWALWQFTHTWSVHATACFAMASIGASICSPARRNLRSNVCTRWRDCGRAGGRPPVFPTGDEQGRMIARDQPVTLAAMEACSKANAARR